MEAFDAFAWARQVADELENEFGERLVFVGLQGSRARGEAHEGSDIDLVVVLDRLDARDLARYRGIIARQPHADLACGFIGSHAVLAAWPRHELFQFVNDTRPVRGTLAGIGEPFTRADAAEAARIGASGIYHAACHASVFDGDAADDILKGLFKGAFFTLQALSFTRTGAYPPTKAVLAAQLAADGPRDEARILEIGRTWDEHRPADDTARQELVDVLLTWSERVLATYR